jgi:hypothetical protein
LTTTFQAAIVLSDLDFFIELKKQQPVSVGLGRSVMNEFFSAAETFVIRLGALALLVILVYKLIRNEIR